VKEPERLAAIAAYLCLLSLVARAEEYHMLTIDSGRGQVTSVPTTVLDTNAKFGAAEASQHAAKNKAVADAALAGFAVESDADRDAQITARTLNKVASLANTSVVDLVIAFDGPSFDFSRLARARMESERGNIVSERINQLEATRSSLARAVQSMNARVVDLYWGESPALRATVAAGQVASIARLGGVRGVELVEQGGQPAGSYNLEYVGIGTRTRDAFDLGFTGQSNSIAAGGRIRIGIIEHGQYTAAGACATDNYPTQNHVAWLLGPPPNSSRLKKVWDCQSGSCSLTATSGGDVHGNMCAGIAAQDLTAFQDAAITTTTERRRRTGMAPGAEIYYYNIGCSQANVQAGVLRAIADGVDVVSMSMEFDACSSTANYTNSVFKTAKNAGILPVAASGNYVVSSSGMTTGYTKPPGVPDGPWNDICRAAWPGTVSEVLQVTGTNTNTAAIADYIESDIAVGMAGIGGLAVATLGGVFSRATSIGLAAPGSDLRMVKAGGYTSTDRIGSSFATPAVAASAGVMRQVLASMGRSFEANNANLLMTYMLLNGDGSNGWPFTSTAYGFDKTKPNPRTGYGRLRMWLTSSTPLTAPYGWGTHISHISTGTTAKFTVGDAGPEPANITEWKWAVQWPESNLQAISDVDIYVYNTCPAGGGGPVLVASQTDYDYRNRIRLTTADISGKCLEMWIYGQNVASGGIDVYSVDMFHSGDVTTP
jgi:hypothetical protein